MQLTSVQGFQVVTGALNWTSPSAQVSAVKQIVVVPGFTVYTFTNGAEYTDHDIALIQLATPTTTPAIPLATDPVDAGLYSAGTAAQMAGWGLTAASATTTPTQLQSANTGVQSDTYCAYHDSLTGAGFDSGDQLCTIDAPADDTATCHGDSGGPLVADIAGAWTQIGLTTYGDDCAPSAPSYFTRIDTYADWIQNGIAQFAPPSVTTGSAHPTESSADITGQLNPNGFASRYSFQWGTRTSYGNTVGAGSTNNGATNLTVSATITGLHAGTTYHYRLVATSTNGTTDGADQTFTTLPAPEWGTYNGRTSQHWPIAIRLSSSLQISRATFSYTLTCARHRVSYSISPLSAGRTWSLNTDNGMGFSHTFADNTGTRYAISGAFTAAGTGAGTLSATWRTKRLGSCSTGRVRWSVH